MFEGRANEVLGMRGDYRVSDQGDTISMHTRIFNRKAGRFVDKEKGQILTKRKNTRGYNVVALVKDGKTIHKRVDEMVLETFVGRKPDGMFAVHDGQRDDDRLEILRWGTLEELKASEEAHPYTPHLPSKKPAKTPKRKKRNARRNNRSGGRR